VQAKILKYAVAIGEATAAVRKLVQTAMEQNKADKQLGLAIKNNTDEYDRQGQSVTKLKKELTEYANARQEATGIDNIATQQNMKLLLSMGVMPKDIQRVTTAFQDMAAGTDVSVETMARAWGKLNEAPEEALGALARAGVKIRKEHLDGMTIEEQRIYVLEQLENKFKGQAEAVYEASGAVGRAETEIGEAGKALGQALLPTLGAVASVIADIAKLFASLPKGAQGAVISVCGSLAMFQSGLFSVFKGGMQALTSPVTAIIGATVAIAGLVTIFKESAPPIGALKDACDDLDNSFKEYNDTTTEAERETARLMDRLHLTKEGSVEYEAVLSDILALNPQLAESNLTLANSYDEVARALGSGTASARAAQIKQADAIKAQAKEAAKAAAEAKWDYLVAEKRGNREAMARADVKYWARIEELAKAKHTLDAAHEVFPDLKYDKIMEIISQGVTRGFISKIHSKTIFERGLNPEEGIEAGRKILSDIIGYVAPPRAPRSTGGGEGGGGREARQKEYDTTALTRQLEDLGKISEIKRKIREEERRYEDEKERYAGTPQATEAEAKNLELKEKTISKLIEEQNGLEKKLDTERTIANESNEYTKQVLQLKKEEGEALEALHKQRLEAIDTIDKEIQRGEATQADKDALIEKYDAEAKAAQGASKAKIDAMLSEMGVAEGLRELENEIANEGDERRRRLLEAMLSHKRALAELGEEEKKALDRAEAKSKATALDAKTEEERTAAHANGEEERGRISAEYEKKRADAARRFGEQVNQIHKEVADNADALYSRLSEEADALGRTEHEQQKYEIQKQYMQELAEIGLALDGELSLHEEELIRLNAEIKRAEAEETAALQRALDEGAAQEALGRIREEHKEKTKVERERIDEINQYRSRAEDRARKAAGDAEKKMKKESADAEYRREMGIVDSVAAYYSDVMQIVNGDIIGGVQGMMGKLAEATKSPWLGWAGFAVGVISDVFKLFTKESETTLQKLQKQFEEATKAADKARDKEGGALAELVYGDESPEAAAKIYADAIKAKNEFVKSLGGAYERLNEKHKGTDLFNLREKLTASESALKTFAASAKKTVFGLTVGLDELIAGRHTDKSDQTKLKAEYEKTVNKFKELYGGDWKEMMELYGLRTDEGSTEFYKWLYSLDLGVNSGGSFKGALRRIENDITDITDAIKNNLKTMIENIEAIESAQVKDALAPFAKGLKEIDQLLKTGKISELEALQAQLEIYKMVDAELAKLKQTNDIVEERAKIAASIYDTEKAIAALIEGEIGDYGKLLETEQGRAVAAKMKALESLRQQIDDGKIADDKNAALRQQDYLLDIIRSLKEMGADPEIIREWEGRLNALVRGTMGDAWFEAAAGSGARVTIDDTRTASERALDKSQTEQDTARAAEQLEGEIAAQGDAAADAIDGQTDIIAGLIREILDEIADKHKDDKLKLELVPENVQVEGIIFSRPKAVQGLDPAQEPESYAPDTPATTAQKHSPSAPPPSGAALTDFATMLEYYDRMINSPSEPFAGDAVVPYYTDAGVQYFDMAAMLAYQGSILQTALAQAAKAQETTLELAFSKALLNMPQAAPDIVNSNTGNNIIQNVNVNIQGHEEMARFMADPAGYIMARVKRETGSASWPSGRNL